ncbi:DUF4129 domain-containing protein [Ornithinimicrobium avium]|uniref:DUF4129 domain-containing protein n=1 Tax=Ornithinimicrobium avium TaxID=2283195 RepID=A0A345NLJ1_9MICO|nr:DUF4129 domain-containing protein [Ornithinimicrobium avium]AXH95899.1 DUF4129 domain-containing protein [Ornithinimicrobium avium]
MRRGTSSTVVVAVVTATALLLLLVWSAGNGTPLVSAPQGSWGPPRAEATASVTTVVDPGPQQQGGQEGSEDLTRWSFNLALLLWLAALVATLTFVVKWLGRQRVDGLERLAVAEEEELVALLDATSDEVRYQALSEGDPRNAVVACWVALEDAVHRSGLAQDRSATATELAHRVLARWDVDPSAITTLSQAYREARFSRHPVTEEQRSLAVNALERIHVDLRRRAAAHASGAATTGGVATPTGEEDAR